jgi:hypothetical protein
MKFDQAGQRFHVITFDADGRVTGEAANITSLLSIDGGAYEPLDDVNPTEIGSTGEYFFELLKAETHGHALSFTPVCSTPGVQVLGVPSNLIYTTDDIEQVLADLAASLDSVQITRLGPEYDPVTRTISLIAGDDYSAANGTALVFAVEIPGVDWEQCTAVLSAQGEYLPVLAGTASIVDPTGDPKIRLEWTREQTNKQPSNKYEWGCAILEGGKVRTVLRGPLCLRKAAVDPTLTDGA